MRPKSALLAIGLALASDGEMLASLWLSLKIAFLTACGSVVLGTFAAFALDKYKRFFGRTLFSGMASAPLVMPEVVIGLSQLLINGERITRNSVGVRLGLPRARHARHLVRPSAGGHGLCHRDRACAPARPQRAVASGSARWRSRRAPERRAATRHEPWRIH